METLLRIVLAGSVLNSAFAASADECTVTGGANFGKIEQNCTTVNPRPKAFGLEGDRFVKTAIA